MPSRTVPPQTRIKLKSGAYERQEAFQVTAKNIVIEGEPEVVLTQALELANTSNVSVSNLRISAYGLQVKSSAKIDLANIVVDQEITRISSSQDVTLSNCLLKGLDVVGSKNTMLNHCTIVTPKDPSLRLGALWLRNDDGTKLINSLVSGERYAICFTPQKPPAPQPGSPATPVQKREASSTILHGGDGLAAETDASGTAASPRGNPISKPSEFARIFKSSSNIFKAPRFANSLKDDFNLVPGSDGSNEGSDGGDCGYAAPRPPPTQSPEVENKGNRKGKPKAK